VGVDSSRTPERGPACAGGASVGCSGAASDGDEAAARFDPELAFQELLAGLLRWIDLQAERLRLTLERSLLRAALGLAFGVFALVWIGAASLAVLRGLRGGLTSLFDGNVWLGDLTAGLLALALLAASVALLLHRGARRELARLKAKYEPEPDLHRHGPARANRNGDLHGVPATPGAADPAGPGRERAGSS